MGANISQRVTMCRYLVFTGIAISSSYDVQTTSSLMQMKALRQGYLTVRLLLQIEISRIWYGRYRTWWCHQYSAGWVGTFCPPLNAMNGVTGPNKASEPTASCLGALREWSYARFRRGEARTLAFESRWLQ